MSDENFNKNTGIILSSSLQVEDNLEYFLTTYLFGSSPSEKRRLFFDEILTKSDFTFERKIRLFKKICALENIDASITKTIFSAIKQIQETRNKVAHWERSVDGLKPRSVDAGKKRLLLDEEFMTQFEKGRIIALRGIVDTLVSIAKKHK